METLLLRPENTEQMKAVKALLTALNINFTSKKEKEYSPDFVKRIQESRQQVREGKVIKIKKTCGVGLSEKADLSYRKNSGIFLLNVRSNL